MTEIDAKLKRVFEIYQMLTGKPDPEQEEQAQKDLLQLFSDIKAGISPDNENFSIISDLHSRISKWDTLDKWFNEEKDLKEKMKEILIIFKFISNAPSIEPKTKAVPLVPAIKVETPEPMKMEEEPEAKSDEAHAPRMKVTFRSKLAAPEIKIPPVMAPKKKISPSTSHIEAPVEAPVEPTPEPQEQPKDEENIPVPETPVVPEGDDVSNVVNEIPRIKINMPSIKINPNPIKITMPKSEPEVKQPVIKPVSPNIPQIRPMGSNVPQIKPVGPVGPSIPQIKPVGQGVPQIKPVGPATPFIKPMAQTVPSATEQNPMAKPQIKAVNNSAPQIKPVAGIQKPFIQPVSSGQQFAKSPDAPQPNPNPFNLPSSEKKPVNLFDQSKKSQNNLFDQKPKQVADESGQDGQLKKISPLNKIDFQANAPMAALSADDEGLLKLPREDLYFELLRSEAKRFFFDKLMNKLQESHSKGQIGEAEFRGAKERNNFELDNEIKRINKIRGMILSVKMG